MKTNFWVVFLIIGAVLDSLSWNYRLTAIPLSTIDLYTEYYTNHQPLIPTIFGPLFVWLSAYFITGIFIK